MIMLRNKGDKIPDFDEDEDSIIFEAYNFPTLSNKTLFVDKLHRYVRLSYASIFLFIIVIPLLVTVIILSSRSNSTSSISCENKVEISSSSWQNSFTAQSKFGVVATDDYRCSKIGADILAKGGNAVDAAIGSALCLGVVSPGSSGLGGGCFLLSYNSTTKKSLFIDSREIAPLGAARDMFLKDPMQSQNGGLAIAVIAELRGLYLAYRRVGGGLDWSSIVTPSVQHALKYEVDNTLAGHIVKIKDQLLSGDFPEISSMFLRPDGSLKQEGDEVQNTKLAETLQNIALHGDSYLHDTMAERLSSEIQDAGGLIGAEEIRSYRPKVREALVTDVFGHTVYGSPPPSSGGAAVMATLKILAGYDQPLVSQGGGYYHHLAEAFKHSFAMRMSLGDPAFVNTSRVVQDMTEGPYLDYLRSLIQENTVLDVTRYGGERYSSEGAQDLPEDHGTSHVSVIDAQGHSVSLTTTVNTQFGSKVMSPSTGIIFNNQMDDFSIPNVSNYFGLAPFSSNYIEAGKRPLSSMSPTIAVSRATGRVSFVGGASGGPRIITGTTQVLLNVIARGMSLLDALLAPRMHSQLLPDELYLEDYALTCPDCGLNHSISVHSLPLMQQSLQSRGHSVKVETNVGFSACQFAELDPDSGLVVGVSDPRKGGMPDAVRHLDVLPQ